MELAIYQAVILLTTLFSGSDARPAASRQATTIQPKQSVEYPRMSQVKKPQDYISASSRQGSLRKRPLAMEVLQCTMERPAVIRRLKRTGQLRKEFFFPSKGDHVSQVSNLPTFEITQRTVDYLGGLIRRKAAAKFSKIRGGKVRRRRYAVQGSRWYKNTITWNIPSRWWSHQLLASDVNKTLTKAFRMWAEVSPLVFRWVDPPAQADITVKFAIGPHGDNKPFDGPGKNLAHAFFPTYGGDIHFDDAESWTATPKTANSKSTGLLPVAVHEIGHSLGLKHSNVSGSIMSRFYSDQAGNVVLSDDDVSAIHSIYGLCKTRVTAIESWMHTGRTYIFNAANYWRFNDYKEESDRGYPLKISSGWKGVPDNVDEVFLWGHNSKIYFFKGNKYYRFNDAYGRVDSNYPIKISEGWPGLPAEGIDAAFSLNDLESYFFKGNKVYKYDNRNDLIANGFPKNISVEFPGIPDNIDSVFHWSYDNRTYFFKDEYYWRWYNHAAVGPKLTTDFLKNICNV